MTVVGDLYPRKLDLGRVVRDISAVLSRAPLPYWGVVIVSGALPSLTSFLLMGGQLAKPGFLFSGLYWLQLAFGLLVGAFQGGCLLFIGVNILSGRPVQLREVLLTGAKYLLPLFAVSIMSFLAIGVGWLLLLIPGVILITAWCVVGPVLIFERAGLLSVFGRSAQLTRGNRWRIVGLFVIALLVIWIVEFALGFGMIRSLAAGRAAAQAAPTTSFLIGGVVIGVVLTALGYAMVSALYVQLCELKQGVGRAAVAEVFD